jgi:hypothetical protein
LDSAGDFWEFSAQKVRTSVSRNYWRWEKPAIGGAFLRLKKEILRNADCLAGDAVLIAPVSISSPP